jgi:hypothetical protein
VLDLRTLGLRSIHRGVVDSEECMAKEVALEHWGPL